MKRLVVLALLLGGASLSSGQTQPGTISTVRVFTEPEGVKFVVDGKIYDRTAVFSWPSGSVHTLSVVLPEPFRDPFVPQIPSAEWKTDCPERAYAPAGTQIDDNCETRWSFTGWSDSTNVGRHGSATTITVVADPSITFYRATFETEVRIRLTFYGEERTPPSGPGACSIGSPPPPPDRHQPGIVQVGSACYWSSGHIWVPKGSSVPIAATPYDGFAFLGFSVNAGPVQPSVSSVRVLAPLDIMARFAPGKSVKFKTDPEGLHLLIDRTEIPTLPKNEPKEYPRLAQFWWAEGTTHVLAAPSPQQDREGTPWFLDSFSIGGGQNTLYTVTDINIPIVITAKFVRGAFADIFTRPAGLKLKIDGRDNWMGNSFAWPLGSKHTISAPPEQTDARGRKYRFKGWSNGGPATQEITVTEAALDGGIRLVAEYELLGQVVIRSTMPGTVVSVDGAECRMPCILDRPEGDQIRISAAHLPLSSVERLEFAGWSDGAPAQRVVKVEGTEALTLTANYRKAYLLQTTAEPMAGAVIVVDPPSPDSFFAEGAQLSITAQVRPGYRFRRWEGDVSGMYRSASFQMDRPRVARAILDVAPFLAESAVKNAAGDTPDAVVAPGSLISIFGASLAAEYKVGPSSPLAQSIAGVTVRVGDRLLPLLFVSPEQINAQLPSDLEEGEYRLAVQREGHEQVSARFQVARNAPGLFSMVSEGKSIALATHEDGRMISTAAPAQKGETITLFGTGFGPYDRRPPDGFATPPSPAFRISDPVEVLIGDRVIEAGWAGAAAGFVGMNVVRFRIPEDLPTASPFEVRVRVNGRDSNTVAIPLE